MDTGNNNSLTSGGLTKGVFKLAGPMFVSSILQNAQSLIDLFWVGRLGSQAVAALGEGVLLVERGKAQPHPAIEVRCTLPDGTEFKAVWSYLRVSGVAKLVTVHFFDQV